MRAKEILKKYCKHEFDFFVHSVDNTGKAVVYVDGHQHKNDEIETFYLKITGKIKIISVEHNEGLVLGESESAYEIQKVDEKKEIYDVLLTFGGRIRVRLDECDVEEINESEWNAVAL